MKLIELVATSEKLDMPNNTMTYTTDVIAEQGIILAANDNGEYDMVIATPIHKGGAVTVIMKPIRTPARKPVTGDLVAYLAVGDFGKTQKEI